MQNLEDSIDYDGADALNGGFAGDDVGESIRVLVRVRPLNDAERQDAAVNNYNESSTISIISSNQLSVTTNDHRKTFTCTYDTVLGPTATQSQVYDKIKDCTLGVLQGVNSTIFAYGQTGSGKTHSMYGPPNYISQQARETELLGIIPRAINHIFEMSKSQGIIDFQVHCSFVQIYNENLYDMLRDSAMNQALTIREDQNKEIYVQGLSEYNVKSVSDTLQLLKIAEENRAIRETHMNQFSSRSHSIFQILVEHKRYAPDGGEVSYKAKFNLVDLAGSEKWDLKRDLRDEHIAEMTNINLSLHTLGKCISSLAKASRKKRKAELASGGTGGSDVDTRSVSSFDKATDSKGNSTRTSSTKQQQPLSSSAAATTGNYHIPYRESKLTRLLQDSLGGNARTFLIATVSPARINCEESISTLKFADRAKQVMVQATINESRPVDHALVQRLQQEVMMWRGLMSKIVQIPTVASSIQQHSGLGVGGVYFNDMEQQTLISTLRECSLLGVGVTGDNAAPPSGYQSPGKGPNVGHRRNTNYMDTSTSPFVEGYKGNIPDSQQQQQYVQQDVVPGGGLEYIISLEKALNKEQTHAQHLTKKNETLIKELEELKLQNMQLNFHNQRLSSIGIGDNISQNQSQQNPSSQQYPSGITIPESEIKQVVDSVHALLHQNDTLYQYTDSIQKTMKKFFKYQIEEDEMKEEMTKLFEKLKEEKSNTLAKKVNDNFGFLEYLQQQARSSQNGPNTGFVGRNILPANLQPFVPPSAQLQQFNAQQQTVSQTPQFNRSNVNAKLDVPTPMKKAQYANPSTNHQGNASANDATPHRPVHSQSLPVIGSQQHQQFSQAIPISVNMFPHVIDTPQPFQFPNGSIPPMSTQISYGQVPMAHGQCAVAPSYGTHQQQPTFQSNASSSNMQQQSLKQQSVNFRVRGAETEDSNQSFEFQDPGETEEERIARELKKAKKKQKQKEKLQFWLREKEEKSMLEQKLQEDERKALQEAVEQREQKRKEYAQKQKMKLQQYQDKIKNETEKIQELINLGIDPSSLNL